jgi:hypothetical protein
LRIALSFSPSSFPNSSQFPSNPLLCRSLLTSSLSQIPCADQNRTGRSAAGGVGRESRQRNRLVKRSGPAALGVRRSRTAQSCSLFHQYYSSHKNSKQYFSTGLSAKCCGNAHSQSGLRNIFPATAWSSRLPNCRTTTSTTHHVSIGCYRLCGWV